MALLAPHRAAPSRHHHQQQQYHSQNNVIANSMEGNEELEEGEARDTNDPNYGPDLEFPHLENKLTQVLGHIRKEFEGGVFPEKLGSKYGGYGTFLPTEARTNGSAAPPPRHTGPPPNTWAANRRSSPKHNNVPTPVPSRVVEATSKKPDAGRGGYSATVSPSLDNKQQSKTESSGEAKKLTLRIKMGSEGTSRGKNTAIYNGLGFSSPSVSEGDDDDEDDEFGGETSPERSPASIIQLMASHPPTAGLLSPLPDLVTLKKEEALKERKQVKAAARKPKDYFDDSLDVDLVKPMKPENGSRPKKSKGKTDDKPVAEEISKGNSFPRKMESKYNEETIDERTNSRNREADMSMDKTLYPEKRKSKDTTDLERSRKKPKSNSSSGSFEMDLPPEKKAKKTVVPPAPATESSFHSAQDYPTKPTKEKVAKVPKSNSKTTKPKTSVKNNKVVEPAVTSAAGFDLKIVEPPPEAPPNTVPPGVLFTENWVECVKCTTWRLLPPNISADHLPNNFICKMMDWLPEMSDCKYSEEQTTDAVRRIFLPLAPPEPLLVPAPPVIKPTLISNKKVPAENDLYTEGNPGKVKPGKQTLKRKDKSKPEDDIGGTKDDKSKKKKTTASRPSKRAKLQEPAGSQRAKYVHPDSSNEVNFFEEGPPKKTSSRDYGSSKKTVVEDRKVDRRAQSIDGSRAENVERQEQVDVRNSAKGQKGLKGKPIRVVASGDDIDTSQDWRGKQQKVNDEEPHNSDIRRKKTSGTRSPRGLSPCASSDGYKARDSTAARGSYDRKVLEADRKVVEADHRHSNGIKDWEEGDGNEDGLWDDQTEVKQQASRHYRDSFEQNQDWDRDRRLSTEGNHEGRASREEKHPSKHNKRPEGTSHHETDEIVKPKVRLKQEAAEEACKYDSNPRKHRDAKRVAENRIDTLKPNVDNNDDRRQSGDLPEAKPEGFSLERQANSAIKVGQSLKHTADRLKNEKMDGATDIYLQAGLKFLEGGALLDRVQLYVDTADLFRFCATYYDSAKDMAGAMLARKCASVAHFRVLVLKNSAMNRDRVELQAALPRVQAVNQTTPPTLTGESPSYSSASDLDNLNGQVMPIDKGHTSRGKSEMAQGSGTSGSSLVPAALEPTYRRYLDSNSDVFEAFEQRNKAEALLTALVTAKAHSPETLATLEKVARIDYGDVQTLVRLVNAALDSIGR